MRKRRRGIDKELGLRMILHRTSDDEVPNDFLQASELVSLGLNGAPHNILRRGYFVSRLMPETVRKVLYTGFKHNGYFSAKSGYPQPSEFDLTAPFPTHSIVIHVTEIWQVTRQPSAALEEAFPVIDVYVRGREMRETLTAAFEGNKIWEATGNVVHAKLDMSYRRVIGWPWIETGDENSVPVSEGHTDVDFSHEDSLDEQYFIMKLKKDDYPSRAG